MSDHSAIEWTDATWNPVRGCTKISPGCVRCYAETFADGISWVIVGGESGNGARPMAPSWVRPIRDQCEAASVPFFFKQWGGVRKKRFGRELDVKYHDDMPYTLGLPMPRLEERRALIAQVETMLPSSS